MHVELIEPILPPEPRPVIGDEKRCAKDAAVHSIFTILLVGLRPGEKAAVGEIGVKTRAFEAGTDDRVVGDILFLGPAGAGDRRDEGTDIAGTSGLGRDDP